jgi:hypothetical protein
MMRFVSVAVLVGLLLTAAAAWAEDNALTPEEQAAGWQLLFDGKTFDGWNVKGHEAGWKIEDGTLGTVVGQDGFYAATDKQYGDFILSIDFKLTKEANSGIFFRWSNYDDPVGTGIEIQVYDSYGQGVNRNSCASVYDCLAPILNMSKPAGEWEHMDLICKDNMICVVHNGMPVTLMDLNKWTTAHKNPDGTDNKFGTAYKDMARSGLIGLQHHGHACWYKNIKILPLS